MVGQPYYPKRGHVSKTQITFAPATALQFSGAVAGQAVSLPALGFVPARQRQGIELYNASDTLYVGPTSSTSPTDYEYLVTPGQNVPIDGDGARPLWGYIVAGGTCTQVELQ